jgi:hypothetical protein
MKPPPRVKAKAHPISMVCTSKANDAVPIRTAFFYILMALNLRSSVGTMKSSRSE